MRSFFYAVVLLCLWANESNAQYFNDFESWPIIAGGTWSQSGPGGTWHGNGVYVNFGNEYSGLRKVGFNDVGDILEMPAVTNPDFITYYARLSSGSKAQIRLEYNEGRGWKTVNTVSISTTSYRRYRGSPRVTGNDVRLRLRMTTYGNSVFLDDVRVETFVLPVELAEFTANAKEDGSVHLHWRTLSETNNERFDVQRSRNGASFKTIAVVPGAGTTTRPQRYSFKDNQPHSGLSYYRLRQVDFDGTEAFSPVRSVWMQQTGSALRLAPTLAHQELWITVEPATHPRQLRIFRQDGTPALQHTLAPGTAELYIDVNSMSKGLYFVALEGKVLRFVKM